MLHRRIRELEQACRHGGIAVPALQGGDVMEALVSGPDPGTRCGGDTMPSPIGNLQDSASNAVQGGATPSQAGVSYTPPGTNPGVEDIASSRPRPEHAANDGAPAYCSPRTEIHPSSPTDPRSNVTGMGAINSVDEGERPPDQVNEYFGSSSTASLIRLLTRDSVRISSRSTAANAGGEVFANQSAAVRKRALSSLIQEDFNQSRFKVEDVLLPSRDFSDHLLECFWDRIYCLYPFFDRASFQDAYENLWISRSQPTKPLSKQDIGLGNCSNSGPTSIVFICALNTMFALGSHFADIPAVERESMAYTFFLRAKQHIGLDMMDIRNVGVIQTLLIVALYLQSTPYPHRCWSSIGVACRLAQGLGMHEAQLDAFKDPLEQEIHRRTWHGCVMMDKIVSMTYGRPSMTSHLPSVPLPGAVGRSPVGRTPNPALMTFYVATIELYQILDSILSDVYNAWRGRSNNSRTGGGPTSKQAGLDVVIELEEKLLDNESNLPDFLSWKHQPAPTADPSDQLILDRQRNVLHARYAPGAEPITSDADKNRFLYLRLLLYRPVFTRLCSETYNKDCHSTLYSSMLSKCAAACVISAVDLISLVYDTYQTPTTDTWWYNGFCTSSLAHTNGQLIGD